jgi:hypothetical protein
LEELQKIPSGPQGTGMYKDKDGNLRDKDGNLVIAK